VTHCCPLTRRHGDRGAIRYALLAARDPSGFENPKGLWHSDSFDASSEEEGGTQVRVYDGAGNDADAGFTVTRDVTAPGVSLAATAEGAGVALVWSASDGGSGLAGCELAYREGAGAWQPYSAACAGEGAFALAQPGTAYTFHLTTTDHVQNQGQAEESATTGRDVTKYYYFDGQRVAMRTPEDEVVWLHGDHLGSTSLATSEGPSPTVVARQLYEPFGAVRWASGTLGTDFGFTGQREDGYIGLVQMGARWYNPYLDRWIQPDTVVSQFENPQVLNRYSYVRNSPLIYTDPTGHQCSIEYDPFTGSYGGKSCFGDVTGMGQTLTVDLKSGEGPPCGTVAQCRAAERRLVRDLWLLATVSFFGPLAAEVAPAMGWFGTGASVVEAACMDGDCKNEIGGLVSNFEASIADALGQFADEAPAVQAERGMRSFGETWKLWAQLEDATENLFVYQVQGKVMGAMKVSNTSGALRIVHLEGLGGGAGTSLVQAAVQESIARGYGGRLGLIAAPQAVSFYEKLGFVLSDPARNWYVLTEEAAQALLGQP
jgi:RHS repeat-associated protein